MLRNALFAACLGSLAGCAARASIEVTPEQGLDMLADMLSGTFSSAAQAERDPVEYFAVRMVGYPIWRERADGPWLYVEQAAFEDLEQPYRQRVYGLQATAAGGFRSRVFELPGDPLEFAGAWDRPASFGTLAPELLIPRSGCEIELEVATLNGRPIFRGGTLGDACSSRRSGAAFTVSEVTVAGERVESWDRGFDESGDQVWGAARGPYVFDRTSFGTPDDLQFQLP